MGKSLARVATSGLHLTDDLKARILSTFLTLMNLRENLDRASMRSSYGRHYRSSVASPRSAPGNKTCKDVTLRSFGPAKGAGAQDDSAFCVD